MTLRVEDWEIPSLRWVLFPFGQFELTRALSLVFPVAEARRKARRIVRPLQRLDEMDTVGVGPGTPGWISEPEALSLIAQLSPQHAQRADAHLRQRFLDQLQFARRYGSADDRAAIAARSDAELLAEFGAAWEGLKAAAAERVRHQREKPPQN